MLLELKTRECKPQILVIELAGRITLGRESTHIEDAVVKAVKDGIRKVVIDLEQVQAIDSSGVGIIAFCFGKLAKEGGSLIVAGATGGVKDILHMTHLDCVIPLSDTAEEACTVLDSQA